MTSTPLLGDERAGIRTEIPGTVLRLEVAAGDTVAEGDAVALLESMKMEIPVLAERAGTIGEVLVSTGDAIPADHMIATMVAMPAGSQPNVRSAS
jgi:acetyl-CoA carboxylase biotin carboxyl carrier protein